MRNADSETTISNADSLINILLCMLGYIPGLLHAWSELVRLLFGFTSTNMCKGTSSPNTPNPLTNTPPSKTTTAANPVESHTITWDPHNSMGV